MDALPAGARGGRPPDLRGEGGGRRIGGAGKLNHAARGRKDRERGRRTCSEQPGVNRAMVMEGGGGELLFLSPSSCMPQFPTTVVPFCLGRAYST
jgi:hypothetical protein